MVFKGLMEEIGSFEKPIQKRLRIIEKNWGHFTAFYFVKGAQATNNWLDCFFLTKLLVFKISMLFWMGILGISDGK